MGHAERSGKTDIALDAAVLVIAVFFAYGCSLAVFMIVSDALSRQPCTTVMLSVGIGVVCGVLAGRALMGTFARSWPGLWAMPTLVILTAVTYPLWADLWRYDLHTAVYLTPVAAVIGVGVARAGRLNRAAADPTVRSSPVYAVVRLLIASFCLLGSVSVLPGTVRNHPYAAWVPAVGVLATAALVGTAAILVRSKRV